MSRYCNEFREQIDVHSDCHGYSFLDWNEAVRPSVPSLNSYLSKRILNLKLNLYPNISDRGLKQDIKSLHNIKDKEVLLYNGSDSCLKDLATVFLSQGDVASVISPTYTQLDCFINIMGAIKKTIVPEDIFRPDLKEMSGDIYQSSIVYLSNPNNPTGILYNTSELQCLSKEFPNTVFIIDEAYIEFSESASMISDECPENVVVLRSFSKSFGIAGLRLGYCVTSNSISDRLKLIHNPKSVNTMAHEAGRYLLLHRHDHMQYIRDIIRIRNYFYNSVIQMGFEAHNSKANFILVKFKDHAAVLRMMADQKIIVRDRSHLPKMCGFLRFTVGSEEQVRSVLSLLKRLAK